MAKFIFLYISFCIERKKNQHGILAYSVDCIATFMLEVIEAQHHFEIWTNVVPAHLLVRLPHREFIVSIALWHWQILYVWWSLVYVCEFVFGEKSQTIKFICDSQRYKDFQRRIKCTQNAIEWKRVHPHLLAAAHPCRFSFNVFYIKVYRSYENKIKRRFIRWNNKNIHKMPERWEISHQHNGEYKPSFFESAHWFGVSPFFQHFYNQCQDFHQLFLLQHLLCLVTLTWKLEGEKRREK